MSIVQALLRRNRWHLIMDTAPSVHPDAANKPKKTPRRHGRVRTELLMCKLGEVVDLSASGMRVLCRSPRAPKPRLKMKFKLKCMGTRVKLHGVIAWVKTEAPGLHIVGVQFSNLTHESNERLAELCAVAGIRRALRPLEPRAAA